LFTGIFLFAIIGQRSNKGRV